MAKFFDLTGLTKIQEWAQGLFLTSSQLPAVVYAQETETP